MGQLIFEQNFPHFPTQTRQISNGTLSFVPFTIADSISLKTLNLLQRVSISSLGNISVTYSLGLYSLNGSTLSLANSLSRTSSSANAGVAFLSNIYFSITNTSATQNITPGNWWWGIVATSDASIINDATLFLFGGLTADPKNAFPSGFIGGAMTVSTNALPSSYAISDLDITGVDALFVPYIILSS